MAAPNFSPPLHNIGVSLVAMSINGLIVIFFFHWRRSAAIKIINIDKFYFGSTKYSTTETHPSVTTTLASHHPPPPVVAPGNTFFTPDVREVKDAAKCVRMTE